MFTDLHLLELDLGTQKSMARPNKRAVALRQARAGLALKRRRIASVEQDSEVVSGAPSPLPMEDSDLNSDSESESDAQSEGLTAK